jgi:hypothetical protein
MHSEAEFLFWEICFPFMTNNKNNILQGSMAQTQNKNNPTHEKPVPATVLLNNGDHSPNVFRQTSLLFHFSLSV